MSCSRKSLNSSHTRLCPKQSRSCPPLTRPAPTSSSECCAVLAETLETAAAHPNAHALSIPVKVFHVTHTSDDPTLWQIAAPWKASDCDARRNPTENHVLRQTARNYCFSWHGETNSPSCLYEFAPTINDSKLRWLRHHPLLRGEKRPIRATNRNIPAQRLGQKAETKKPLSQQ